MNSPRRRGGHHADRRVSFQRRPAIGRTRGFARRILMIVLVTAGAAGATHAATGTPRCSHHSPQRNVYWGDLHVHTSYSMDAYVFDTRLTPDDAYRFARGGVVELPTQGAAAPRTPFALERPLDFAAVTDHAHSFGGVRLCTDPRSTLYAAEICRRYRSPFVAESGAEKARDIVERIDSLRSEPLCGPDGARCRDAALEVWRDTQAAAARWDDAAPSCDFTTFVAYEYTLTPRMTKIHRNVIFRNQIVPTLPITAFDEPTPTGLWQALHDQCLEGLEGCDVLAIPHNPNLSNGHMFTIEYPEGASRAEQVRLASLRARMEPVVEMMQIKGSSECANGLWKVLGNDEECGFENLREDQDAPACEGGVGWGALAGEGCESRLDYTRYALIEGLREADRIGVNPYRFGVVGSTDIHTGTPGAVDEWATESFEQIGGVGYNLGGLAAVWAEENTRDSIFDALLRREVYATSGPRISVRFFGGWELAEDLCGSAELVERGYADGVPMGAELPAAREGAPRFVAWAARDPGTAAHPGGLLERIQIVKGWSDPDGTFHQEIVDVAGEATADAPMDADCRASRGGERELCAVWTDPDFDPGQRALYYARVLERPSCRFSARGCSSEAGVGVGDARESDHCAAAAGQPATIRERAWTSPIWYTPSKDD